jgi:predicted transcriptional regulator
MPRKQPNRQLSKAEWEIMKVLWEHGDMALGEVVEKLDDDQN